MKYIQRIIGVTLTIFCITTQAAIVEGLYEAEVVVESQAKSVRENAMKMAIQEVFEKVSGQSNVASYQGVEQVINAPTRYVQQYRYRKLTDAEIADRLKNQQVDSGQVVWIRFDERAINSVLRENNLPVWGKTRPATLVWLAVEQDGGRYLLGSDTLVDLRHSLEQEAKKRGMALIIPLWDLEDQMALPFADVWGDFKDTILKASQRYQAEAVLVGRMSLSRSDVWNGRWTLYEGGGSLSWNFQGTLSEHVLSAGVAGTMEVLARRYAMVNVGNAPTEIVLSVSDVLNLVDYVKVTKYLSSLEQIKGIQTAFVDADSVAFRLQLRGSAEGLKQTIALGNILAAEQQNISTGTEVSPFGGFQNQPANLSGEDNYASQFKNNEYQFRLLP